MLQSHDDRVKTRFSPTQYELTVTFDLIHCVYSAASMAALASTQADRYRGTHVRETDFSMYKVRCVLSYWR